MPDGTSRLNWRDANRGDRGKLKQFVCTTPEKASWVPLRKGKFHPRQWELDVQSTVRNLKPPTPPGERIRLGFDDVGLAAVVNIARAKGGDHGVVLQVIAVAQRLRRAEPRFGPEALDEAVRVAAEFRDGLGGEAVGLFTRTVPKNAASKRMLTDYGFIYLDLAHNDEVAPGPDRKHQCVSCVEAWVYEV